jgi:hypothetical protein
LSARTILMVSNSTIQFLTLRVTGSSIITKEPVEIPGKF